MKVSLTQCDACGSFASKSLLVLVCKKDDSYVCKKCLGRLGYTKIRQLFKGSYGLTVDPKSVISARARA